MGNTTVYKANFLPGLIPFVLPIRNFIQEIGTSLLLKYFSKWAARVEDWALQLNSLFLNSVLEFLNNLWGLSRNRVVVPARQTT